VNYRACVVSLIVLSFTGLGGCASTTAAFVPLGSHTLRVAPEKDADVVWLVKAERTGKDYTETVMRCNSTDAGPVCNVAKVPQ
jgi:hypothetical protein